MSPASPSNISAPLLRDYADEWPRKTKVEAFDTIEVRELTAEAQTIYHDKENTTLERILAAATIFQCSPYDKLVLVWNDCRYRVIPRRTNCSWTKIWSMPPSMTATAS